MDGRLFAVSLAALVFAGNCYAAPPAHKHKPDFKLTISTEDTIVKAKKDIDIEVTVKVRNISLHTVPAGRWLGEPGVCYTISVLRDGHPAPITESFRNMITPKKDDPQVAWVGSLYFVPIRPFRSRTFGIILARYFELDTPGKYEITFTAGTNPGQPDNVEVKSNTITITVLPPETR
jgi:hypothetical protein